MVVKFNAANKNRPAGKVSTWNVKQTFRKRNQSHGSFEIVAKKQKKEVPETLESSESEENLAHLSDVRDSELASDSSSYSEFSEGDQESGSSSSYSDVEHDGDDLSSPSYSELEDEENIPALGVSSVENSKGNFEIAQEDLSPDTHKSKTETSIDPRLARQIASLCNKVSESNLESIVCGLENLYGLFPRGGL
jgi:hypothetical protein